MRAVPIFRSFYFSLGCLVLFVLIALSSLVLPMAVTAAMSSEGLLMPPLSDGHIFGTDHLGRDVLALLYNACGFHLVLGLGVLLLSAILGVPMGIISGFDLFNEIRFKLWALLCLFFGLLLGVYYLFVLPFRPINWIVYAVLIMTIGFVSRKLFGNFTIVIPFKKGIDTLIDLINVLPRFLIVFVVMAILPQGLTSLILVLGLTSWVPIARIVRAETLKLKAQPFVEAGRALGFSNHYLVFRYILPSIWPVVITLLSYGFASTVLAEAALGFLDMGASADWITWGRLILYAKSYLHAWWLLVFPLLCIFVLSFSLFTLAKYGERGTKIKWNFELVS